MSVLTRVLMTLVHNGQPASLSAKWRRDRVAQFTALLATLPRPVSILDVGGTARFWRMVGLAEDPDIVITTLNRKPELDAMVRSLVGDARAMTAIADRQFDVVFSNSVIEHVGTLEDQARMAAEVRRVGKRYFLQTPNRYFPIEPHFLFPCWQFLPVWLRIWIVGRWNVGWYKKTTDTVRARAGVTEIRLLTTRELRALFPHAQLVKERFCGLTKSLLVYDGWDATRL